MRIQIHPIPESRSACGAHEIAAFHPVTVLMSPTFGGIREASIALAAHEQRVRFVFEVNVFVETLLVGEMHATS